MRIMCAVLLVFIIPVTMGSANRTMTIKPHWLAEFRDSTCHWETRGKSMEDRIDALGAAKEAGYCQVKKGSAAEAKFFTTNHKLLTKDVNFAASLAVLAYCAKKHQTRNLHRISFCYNGGPRARYHRKHVSWGYANEVVRMHYYRMEL